MFVAVPQIDRNLATSHPTSLNPSNPRKLRREFAVYLVKEGLLPRHQARQLAALERVAFEDLLARRGVAFVGDWRSALLPSVQIEVAEPSPLLTLRASA